MGGFENGTQSERLRGRAVRKTSMGKKKKEVVMMLIAARRKEKGLNKGIEGD
jgi:hypothetical protein